MPTRTEPPLIETFMLEQLKQDVCDANLRLVTEGLVFQTWGNVSGVDREAGVLVIKPSGVNYDGMHAGQMVVVSLETGDVVEGDLNPSSDTPTHRALYNAWPTVGGIVHTHSLYSTAFAQAQRAIQPMGTTHADFCYGPVPCTRPLTPEEIQDEYEANTGHVIAETLQGVDPIQVPAIVVAEHGPFAWGINADKAVTQAATLEQVARMATETLRLAPDAGAMRDVLLDKHFLRKHGPGAYYGQK